MLPEIYINKDWLITADWPKDKFAVSLNIKESLSIKRDPHHAIRIAVNICEKAKLCCVIDGYSGATVRRIASNMMRLSALKNMDKRKMAHEHSLKWISASIRAEQEAKALREQGPRDTWGDSPSIVRSDADEEDEEIARKSKYDEQDTDWFHARFLVQLDQINYSERESEYIQPNTLCGVFEGGVVPVDAKMNNPHWSRYTG